MTEKDWQDFVELGGPSMALLLGEIRIARGYAGDYGLPGMDIALLLASGGWEFFSGPPQYYPNLEGEWAGDWVPSDGGDWVLEDIAESLAFQVLRALRGEEA